MQTFATNIVRPNSRNRVTGERLGVRLAIACTVVGVLCGSVMTAQTHGQTSQLSGWDAPEFNPPATSPSNQVRSQIGLTALPEAPTAGTNTSVSLPPAPGPLLAPVHAPIQIPNQTYVQTATFETEVLNPETDTVPAANGFAQSLIAGGVVVGTSDHLDDHLLRPSRGRADFVTAGVWRSTVAADASHHGVVIVFDDVDHGTGLEPSKNRSNRSIHT